MGRILVTGAAGTIGLHVTSALLECGHSVVGVSLEPTSSISHKHFTYQKLDIGDYQAIDSMLSEQSIDGLIHLAALVHVRDSKLSFSDYCRQNFRASEHLFQKAYSHGVRRIVFASTIEVYGPTPSKRLVNEDISCRPESDYARSKLLGEEALVAAASLANASYSILRLAPVYASDFRLNLNKRLYLRAPTIGYYVSKGDYELSLCSIRNIEHFVIRWLELESATSGVFNLADARAYPVRELLESERRKGRCPITLRLPYFPCLGAIAILETCLALVGRQSNMATVGNVRKLIRSTAWDTSRAEQVVGHLPWNMENTMNGT